MLDRIVLLISIHLSIMLLISIKLIDINSQFSYLIKLILNLAGCLEGCFLILNEKTISIKLLHWAGCLEGAPPLFDFLIDGKMLSGKLMHKIDESEVLSREGDYFWLKNF